MKLAREQVQQIQYIGRAVNIPVVRGKWQLLLSREACVFLKPVTSKLSWFHGVNSSSDSEGEVGIEKKNQCPGDVEMNPQNGDDPWTSRTDRARRRERSD